MRSSERSARRWAGRSGRASPPRWLAIFTAFSYAELVSKYPRAGGAAVYTNKAFCAPFFTFVVAFAVMASGVASASTLARAFAGDYLSEYFVNRALSR
jgi:basic amino acid/polyamine antiporter, APA family